MYKKLLAIIEMISILLICAFKIFPHWDKNYTSPGDLFCLEIVGLLSWNIYENLKKKI